MKTINKKIILILIITIVFSPFLAPRAQAQYVDISNAAKELIADSIGWSIPKTALQRMTASTVNWINSGFQGSPAFITNPGSYFLSIGDDIAGDFIFNNPDLNFLCGPIAAKIKISLAKSYVGGGQERWQCTLTEVGQNMEDFMGDFNNGGWDNFFEISQRTQNSPLGAYMQAENEMNKQIADKVNSQLNELNQSGGFLSWEKCPDGGDDCEDSEKITQTPGSVIAGKLNDTLGKGEDALVTADELNELVGALLNQLTTRVMGGVGGLLGSSGRNNDEPSLTTQLLQSTAKDTTDYFGNTQQDTETQQTPSVQINDDNQVLIIYEPVGSFDSVGCDVITGWTCDANDYNAALDVHIYDKEIGNGGVIVGVTTANVVAEQEVATMCGGKANHRFSFVTPDSLKDGLPHNIFAYSINIPQGNNPKLAGSPRLLMCPVR